MEARCRARSRAGYLRLSRYLQQLCGLLRQSRARVEDGVQRKPREAGGRLQEIRGGAEGGLRFVPRYLPQGRSLVSRFRSSHTLAAPPDANFGIKGTLATYDS